jgi:hypothetical protein
MEVMHGECLTAQMKCGIVHHHNPSFVVLDKRRDEVRGRSESSVITTAYSFV